MSRNQETVFIEGFKIAVALSIIKNKPSDLSTGEYVRKLSEDYRKLQHEWKSKYDTARNEILALKQRTVLYESGLNYASGSYGITEYEDLSTALPSSLDFTISVKENTIFLQKILNIRHSIDKMKNNPAIKKTAKDTILYSLEVILKSMQNDKIPISIRNIEECLRLVRELNSLWYGKEYRNINAKVLDILNSLVSKLLYVDGLNPISIGMKENLKQLVMSLTNTNHLANYAAIMNIMMMHCATFCEKLRTAQTERDTIHCSDYENIIYLVEIINTSLKGNQSLLTDKEGQCLCKVLQVQVDKALLHISNNFPLVAHALWKISGILQNYIDDFH